MKKFHSLIKFPSFDTKNGVLTMFECGKKIDRVPFTIKRTLVIQGMKKGDSRGGHTHHKTNQILICVQGSCTVGLDDGENKLSIQLSKPNQGVFLKPYLWHTMTNFSANCILLVLADRALDEKDYIRSYDEFKKYTEVKPLRLI